jgi:type IV fimbrial biogenesis protein FimT
MKREHEKDMRFARKAKYESPAQAAGFTLIELMTVLVIAGLALTLALPAFQGMTERQQLNTAAIDMLHAIQLTRSEALRRKRTVQMAPLDDADWTLGWRIYASVGENGPYRDGDQLILQRSAPPGGIEIESHTSSPSEIQIAYNGGGRSVRRNRMGLAGSWRLRLKQETRIIAINILGRARICDPARDRGRCDWKPQ